MGKVYIVTSGTYENYGIEAVFNDIEAAKNFCRYYNVGQTDGTSTKSDFPDYNQEYRIETFNLNKRRVKNVSEMFAYIVVFGASGRVVVYKTSIYDVMKYNKIKKNISELPYPIHIVNDVVYGHPLLLAHDKPYTVVKVLAKTVDEAIENASKRKGE